MHEVLVNRLGGLSLPRKSVVRLTDRPDMTLDVYPGHKTTIQQYNKPSHSSRAVRICLLLTLLHSERPKLYGVLPFLSAIGLKPLIGHVGGGGGGGFLNKNYVPHCPTPLYCFIR